MKECTRCHIPKQLSAFAKNSRAKDGHNYHCKECQSKIDKSHALRPKIELTEKECTACGVLKPIDEFAKATRNIDGRQDWCNDCRKLYNDENRDQRLASYKDYHKRHRDELLLRYREYYQQNREYWLQRAIENFQKFKGTPEYFAYTARKNSRRRARNQAVEDTLTVEERELIMVLQSYRCACCGCEFDPQPRRSRSLTWDHVVPLSKGAGLTFENAQALCLGCNTRKGTRIVDYRTWDPVAIIRNVKRA